MKTFSEFMKQLEEAIDPKLSSLFQKHNLTANKNGSKVDSFNFNSTIHKDFAEAGYHIGYNSKTDKFHVQSHKDSNKNDELEQQKTMARRIKAGRAVSRLQGTEKMLNPPKIK